MVEAEKIVKNDKRYKPRLVFQKTSFFADWDVGPDYEIQSLLGAGSYG
jgi:hypothetical protein